MKQTLEIKNLSVTVQKKTILKNVSLSIEPGAMHLLMGPNGSGKSTLAHMLSGDPASIISSGSIFLDGVDLLTLTPDERAQSGLFLAFQHPPEIPGLTVFSFLKEVHNARFKKNISTETFRDLLYRYMDILNIDQRFAFRDLHVGFSGGEKKRLELLQLLLLKPRLAVLDEIDSGVDADALNLIVRGIKTAKQENKSISFLVISHYQKIVTELSPEVVHIFSNGTIVHSGGIACAQKINREGYGAFL